MLMEIIISVVFILSLGSTVDGALLQKDTASDDHKKIEPFLQRFIEQNAWRDVLLITDKDFMIRRTLHVMQDLSVSSLVLVVKPNSTFLSNHVLLTRNIIVWCEIEQQSAVISWAERNGMFRKDFSWLFLLKEKLTLSKLLELLDQSMLLVTNVFTFTYGAGSELAKIVPKRKSSQGRLEAHPQLHMNIRRGKEYAYPLKGFDFRIGTVHAPPLVVIDVSGTQPVFSGYIIEIMKLLSQYLGFSFVAEQKGYGSLKDGSWTGLVGSVLQKRFDIGGFIISKTLQRASVVDFASYILQAQYAVAMRAPNEAGDKCIFSVYTKPLSAYVWISCAAIFLLTLTCMYFTVQQFSCNNTPTKRQLQKRNQSLCWSLIAVILQTGVTELPNRRSTQSVFLIFICFSILVCKIYASLLTASLTVRKGPQIYNDLDELINDGKYGIAVIESMSAIEFLKNGKSATLRRIWDKIQSKPGSLVTNAKAGYAKVLNEDYVLINIELNLIHAVSTSNCKMVILKQRYLPVSGSFFFPKNSSLVEIFSLKIQTLRSSGMLKKLSDIYIPNGDPEKCKSGPTVTVHLMHSLGAFAVLGIGNLISAICLIIEIMQTRFSEIKGFCANHKFHQ